MTALFRTPIVVVLGATGAGKSKLALELAQRFKGEIISADAMQMYHGLDIATNKVTEEELKSVKHHMIDMLDPLNEVVRVNDFRNACLPIMENLLSKGVIPFICGGTNYYIESLLWKILVDNIRNEDSAVERESNVPYVIDDDFSVPTHRLYSELCQLDPERAATLHQNERRKIYRSLQVYYQSGGRKHSDFIKNQRVSPDGSSPSEGPHLRYKNVCILWVDTDLSVLDERCDRRVDKMIQRGLLKELEDFNQEYNKKRDSASDYTKGIFQSIGFKEFHGYLMLDEDAKGTEGGQKLFEEGVVALKNATHRYARSQLRWIRRRFLNPLNTSNLLHLYKLDSSYPSQWREDVYEPSVKIVEAFIEGKSPLQEPVPLLEHPEIDPQELKKVFACEVCQMQVKGIIQYRAHLVSKKHKYRVKEKTSGPLFSLSIELDKEAFKDSDSLALIKALKRISRGQLSTSDIALFLKRKEDSLDLKVQVKEYGAKRHIEELRALNIIGHMASVIK